MCFLQRAISCLMPAAPKMATQRLAGLSAEHRSDLMSEDSHRHDADHAAPRYHAPDMKMHARRQTNNRWPTT